MVDSPGLNLEREIFQLNSSCYQIMIIAKRRVNIGLLDITSHEGLIRVICFFRSTTENVAGIAATAKALRLAMEKLDLFTSKTSLMKAVIHQALLEYPDIFVFSGEDDFAPHILTFGIKGVRGEVIVHAFEDYDIFISTTSACSSKAGKPAGTLIAMGVEKDKAQSAVRVSLDLENDMSQVEQFLTKLKLIYNQTRKVR